MEQVAILLIFPAGVSEKEAREATEKAVRELPEQRRPQVEAVETFAPDEDQWPVIYFP